jgi:ERF superfamily
VHQSSESIGAVAAALAKAQSDLTNPEKSLLAIIQVSSRGEYGRAFRYASLSSGLDIARKSLSRQAIAIVQSTIIDNDAGLVRLNTVLAHSSGEWVSSEWPVCPISDIASPRRMGAALTYARRYALFTLVGIAGEDDLDAPDLAMVRQFEPDYPSPATGQLKQEEHGAGSRSKRLRHDPKPLLKPEASAVLRDQLLAELAASATDDEALAWAHRSLPAKNRLTSADAAVIEQAFQVKMPARSSEHENTIVDQLNSERGENRDQQPTVNVPIDPLVDGPKLAVIDAGQNAVPRLKPIRKRDRPHREFVCAQPCLVCGRKPSDAHHVRFGQPRALGLKVSDEFTVPLCRVHHRDLHRRSDEKKWWEAAKIEPMEIAQRLWLATRGKSG